MSQRPFNISRKRKAYLLAPTPSSPNFPVIQDEIQRFVRQRVDSPQSTQVSSSSSVTLPGPFQPFGITDINVEIFLNLFIEDVIQFGMASPSFEAILKADFPKYFYRWIRSSHIGASRFKSLDYLMRIHQVKFSHLKSLTTGDFSGRIGENKTVEVVQFDKESFPQLVEVILQDFVYCSSFNASKLGLQKFQINGSQIGNCSFDLGRSLQTLLLRDISAALLNSIFKSPELQSLQSLVTIHIENVTNVRGDEETVITCPSLKELVVRNVFNKDGTVWNVQIRTTSLSDLRRLVVDTYSQIKFASPWALHHNSSKTVLQFLENPQSLDDQSLGNLQELHLHTRDGANNIVLSDLPKLQCLHIFGQNSLELKNNSVPLLTEDNIHTFIV